MKKYRILFACVFLFIFVSFAGCEFADIVDLISLYELSFEKQSELQETSYVSEKTSAEETSIEETETEPCTHSRTQPVTEAKRSCTTHGKIKIVCLDCKETIEKIKKDPLGHQYGGWVTVSEVSADTDGVKYRECGRCKEREYETIPAGYSTGLEFISYGDGTCYLASIGSCKSLDIVVPEVSPDGDIVIAVGDNAFYDEEAFWSEDKICEIESITLPDSVEVIGKEAFCCCMNLVSVKLPENLKIIGEGAFEGCDKLVRVNFPPNLKIIEKRAFYFCVMLSGVVLPEGVTDIGESAFFYCDKLAELHIPASVERIGDCVVADHIQKITVSPKNQYYSVENNCLISKDGHVIVGYGKFQIPSRATSIGERAFMNNLNVFDIVLPSGVMSIGKMAFAYSSVTNVTLPDGLTKICDGVFFDCTNLKSVTIPRRATLPSLHPQNNYCTL